MAQQGLRAACGEPAKRPALASAGLSIRPNFPHFLLPSLPRSIPPGAVRPQHRANKWWSRSSRCRNASTSFPSSGTAVRIQVQSRFCGGDLASTWVAKQRRAYRGRATSSIRPEKLNCKRELAGSLLCAASSGTPRPWGGPSKALESFTGTRLELGYLV